MRQQEATTVVSLPVAEVMARLREVETWPAFLHGIGSIRQTGPERYLFGLDDGRDHREIPMVVRLRPRQHAFVWHPVSGSAVRGSITLTPVDDRHTSVTLQMAALPSDLRSGLVDMLMPERDSVSCDVRQLERHLIAAAG